MNSSSRILIFILVTFLTCYVESSRRRKCQISVLNAKVQRLKPKLLRIICHPGYSTSTGQDQMVVQCKKALKSHLNLCHPLKKKVHHPYPLFQSDDPNVDDNIILLDNDQGTKETGVYTHNNYDQDYAEYDYKGDYNEDYDPEKDYGDYYDYDYDKSKDDYGQDENVTNGENVQGRVEPDLELIEAGPEGNDMEEASNPLENPEKDYSVPLKDTERIEELEMYDEYDQTDSVSAAEVQKVHEESTIDPELKWFFAEEMEVNHDTLEKPEEPKEFLEPETPVEQLNSPEPDSSLVSEEILVTERPEESLKPTEPDMAEDYLQYDEYEDNEELEELEEPEEPVEAVETVEPEELEEPKNPVEPRKPEETVEEISNQNETNTDDESSYDEDYDYDDEDYEDYDEDEDVEEEENTEETEEDTEVDPMYRDYEILSDFYKKHFVDLRVLDSSCEPSRVPPPKIEHGYVKEYLTTENVLLPGQQYHEVVYGCDPGHKLSSSSLGHMFCQQQGWMGVEPYCEYDPEVVITVILDDVKDYLEEEINACDYDQGCEYKCQMIDEVPTCICQEGYVIDDVTTCIDIDECARNNGGCEHNCLNKPGTFQCECPTGYRADDLRCVDNNECVSNNGHGPCQDTCINNEGGYKCSCEGLPGTRLSPDGKTCKEIDLCEENNGGCSHDCQTSYGQSFCTCPSGKRLAIDWKTCIPQVSDGEEPVTCGDGYKLNTDTDSCEDVNECDSSPCGVNGNCLNETPGYKCNCHRGYEFDGTTCIDANECLDQVCDNGVCINTKGSYQCQCHPGYQVISDGSCQDINECLDENVCNGIGTCLNLEGGFDCDCPDGYISEPERGGCVDVNECKVEKHVCGKGAVCINSEGSYECKCKKDEKVYDPILKKCKRTKCPPDFCSSNGRCIVKNQRFSCVCKPGFTGTKCEADIDECESNNPCQHKCKNINGSYKCTCDPGYVIQNVHECIDIDECLNSAVCDNNSVCVNTPGTFRCECKEGFSHDQKTQKCKPNSPQCELECSHSCGPDGNCLCPKGYILNTVNNVECLKKKKRKKKKKKIHGCQTFNATEGLKVTYSKNIDTETKLYPRSVTLKGKCMEGYKASPGGRLRVKCKKDGSWKGNQDLSCKLITCPVIDQLDIGVVVEPESCTFENSLVKQKCLFSCAEPDKYKLIGTKVARCRKTGLWKQKGGPPKCIEKRKKKKKKKKTKKKPKNKPTEPKSIGHPIIPSPSTTLTLPTTTTTTTPTTTTATSTTTISTTTTRRPPWPTTIPWEQTWAPTRPTKVPKWTPEPNQQVTVPIQTTIAPTTNQSPSVSPQLSPFIYCPPNVVKDLPNISPNISAQTVYVRIPQPKTNVNWYDYVKSYPPWAKSLEAELGLGKTLVTFTATSPNSNEVASCSFSIHVRDIIPPRVYNCPNDFDIYLDKGEIEKRVFWKEPIFADNVKIAHVMASKLPGYKMKAGRHDVLYQAADSDGNKARCVFTVTVWDNKYSWVMCREGNTGRQIKLYLSYVPNGCERISN